MSSGEETIPRLGATGDPNDPAEAAGLPDRSARFTISRDVDPLPPELAGAVVALGNFDGVHRGHRALIDAVREEARRFVPRRPPRR